MPGTNPTATGARRAAPARGLSAPASRASRSSVRTRSGPRSSRVAGECRSRQERARPDWPRITRYVHRFGGQDLVCTGRPSGHQPVAESAGQLRSVAPQRAADGVSAPAARSGWPRRRSPRAMRRPRQHRRASGEFLHRQLRRRRPLILRLLVKPEDHQQQAAGPAQSDDRRRTRHERRQRDRHDGPPPRRGTPCHEEHS